MSTAIFFERRPPITMTKCMVTMSNKRKGTATMASTSFSVAVTPYDTDEEWLDTRQKLKELRTFSMDNLISSFNSCVSLQQELQQEQTHIVQASQEIKNKLASRIELAREACKEESDDLYRMELTLEQLQADRHALIQSLEELDSLQIETKDRILQHKEVASLYIEEIDQVEAERMDKVPRLKQQISLYATSTGIKWDFDQESLLAGQVAVPPKGSIRRFSIDPNDYSNFEIANHLWSLMETGKYAASIASE